MSLLKTRPTLHLEVPPTATLGRRLDGALVVDVAEPVEVDAITVTLRGESGAINNRTFPLLHEETARLGGRQRLGPGSHRLPFSLPVPETTVPSYRHAREWRVFVVRARVDIPWWPDATAERPVHVAPAFPGRVAAEPRSTTSAAGDDDATRAARIELTIDGDAVHVGDVVSGQVALSVGGDGGDVRGVRLILRECLGDGFDDHFETLVVQQVEAATIALDELRGERPVDFAIEVPASFVYSFRAPDRRRFHELVARFDEGLLPSLDPSGAYCPLRVLPAEVAIARRAVTRQPLGATRREQQVADVAARLGATARGAQMARSCGPVRALVSTVVAGEWRRLEGELTYPDLALGLSLGLTPGGSLTLGGREAAPCDALRLALAPRLEPFAHVRGGDTVLTVQTGHDDSAAALEAFAGHVFALAGALERALGALPPPAALADRRPLFEELARSLAGELRPGSMIVEGTLDEHPVELRPRWRGERLDGFTARLVPTNPVDPALHTADPSSPALPDEARRLLAHLAAGGARVVIGDRGLELSAGPWLDRPATALGWLRSLAALARALEPRQAAYR